MKWFFRILYALTIIMLSVMIYYISLAEKYQKFYHDHLTAIHENYDRTKYLEVLMTDNVLLESYLKDPIYVAKSSDVNREFEVSLIQFRYLDKGDNQFYYVTTLFFKDFNIRELNEFLEHPNYKKNNNLVYIEVKIKYENISSEVTRVINSNYLKADVANIATITTFKNDELSYVFVKDDGVVDSSQLIEAISINIVSNLNGNEEVVPILTMTHFNTNDNVGENIIVAGNATNFNGNVSFHSLESNYNNENLKGKILTDELNKYNYIMIRINVIYYLIVILITYGLFFFKPTKLYFKNKSDLSNGETLHDN